MGKIKTPDGQEIELNKGEALAQREDGKWEVIKPKQVEGATRTVTEDYKHLLGEVVTAAQEGRVEREKMVTALNDLTTAVGKLPKSDPAMEPDKDPSAIRSMDEIMQMDLPENDSKFDWIRVMQRAGTRCYLANHVRELAARKRRMAPPDPRASREYQELCTLGEVVLPDRVRVNVWNPGTSTYGGNWVPTGIASEYTLAHRLQTDAVAMFKRITIPDGVKALQFPCTTSTTVATVRTLESSTHPIAPVATGDTIGNPTTGVLDLTPKELETPYYTLDIQEETDATVSAVQVAVEEARECLMASWESAIFNAQTASDSNLDSTYQSVVYANSGDGYATAAANYGLRGYSIYYLDNQNASYDVTNAGGADLAMTSVYDAWKTMGDYGMDIGQRGQGQGIAIFTPAKPFFDMMVDDDVRKYVNFGPGNTMPSGAVAMVMGMSVVPTSGLKNCLATGKIGASANNYTSVILCNLKRWRIGYKTNAEVVLIDAPGERAVNVRGFARHCIGAYPPASDTHTVAIVNISAT